MTLPPDALRHYAPGYRHLRRGRTYVVAEPFVDYDRTLHPAGETWTFVGSGFLPYDDGLTLVAVVDGAVRYVRLQLRADEQQDIADRLDAHLVDVNGADLA